MRALPLTPTLAEFRLLAAHGNLVPVYAEMIADAETPVSVFQKLDNGRHTFLLESVEQTDQTGRFSFVGTDPRWILESRGRTMRLTEEGKTREWETEHDVLHELEHLMARYRAASPESSRAEPSRFTGGAVGYLSFDSIRFLEPTVGLPEGEGLGLPDACFLLAETVVIFDHRTRRLRLLTNALIENDKVDAAYTRATAQLAALAANLEKPGNLPPLFTDNSAAPIVPACNTTRAEYEGMVSAAQEYIRAGDIFQIVPSQRFETAYSGDPLTLYRTLRYVNPSPYMFCLQFAGQFALVGSSPEVHVRATAGKVELRPIAGTRRRGADESEDAKNAEELLADPKERAEHLMLVDLARNDVGRIAEYGSVVVSDFMTIERYSHVMHIVSHVTGTLRADCDAYDVMRATFPAGTVSGSPKVRAMQILAELEKNRRGVYGGAVGYFGFDGDCDSCIALRTVILQGGKAYVQAGAGVVADSTPEGEYHETVNKAMGMMAAIARARAAVEARQC